MVSETAEPDLEEGREVGRYQHIQFKARIGQADRDIFFAEEEPETLPLFSREVEANDELALRELVSANTAAYPPHKQYRVEFLFFRLFKSPVCSPNEQRIDDSVKFLTGLSQIVGCVLALVGAVDLLDQPHPLQAAQPFGQEGAGDAGEAAFQVVEVRGSGQHVADDEQRPTVAEDFDCFGYGAVLAVFVHIFLTQRRKGAETQRILIRTSSI